jgi:putative cardiolipin synthase
VIVVKRICKSLLWILSAYLLFALIASSIPYISPVMVSEHSEELLLADEDRSVGPNMKGEVTLIESTEDAFNIRVELLRSAQRQVDFVCHTIHAGESGEAFLAEIVKAADRGVKVRILLDAKVGATSHQIKRIIKALNQHENIECRRYNSVNLLSPWKWQSLLHDKFILVDGELLLLGGRNIGDRYFAPDGYTGAVVNDRDVLVRGESASDAVEEYMSALWEHEATKPYPKNTNLWRTTLDDLVRFNESFEERNQKFYRKTLNEYLDEMVPATSITFLHNPIHPGQTEPWVAFQMVDLAKEGSDSIIISTPYATANPLILDVLGEANQNVELSMVTNSMVSSPNYPAFSNYYYNRDQFLATGMTIHEYLGDGSLHGKSLVIDGQISAVGSFNLDDRSSFINTESVLVIDSPEFADVLTCALEEQIQQSSSFPMHEKDGTDIAQTASVGKRLMMHLAYLFFRPISFLL